MGDILFIKGLQFPRGANGARAGGTRAPAACLSLWLPFLTSLGRVPGLVHKSPEKRYDERGRILNRLVLKIDVASLPEWAAEMAAEEDGETQLDEAFRTLSTRTAPPRVPVPPREPPVHPTGGTWV